MVFTSFFPALLIFFLTDLLDLMEVFKLFSKGSIEALFFFGVLVKPANVALLKEAVTVSTGDISTGNAGCCAE